MEMTATWRLDVVGGQKLQFEVYGCTRLGWYDRPGLYIFCCLGIGDWIPVYVGQTESFEERMASHERFDEAVKCGATHIHALVVPDQLVRDEWEHKLIQTYQPPLNIQRRGLGLLRNPYRGIGL